MLPISVGQNRTGQDRTGRVGTGRVSVLCVKFFFGFTRRLGKKNKMSLSPFFYDITPWDVVVAQYRSTVAP